MIVYTSETVTGELESSAMCLEAVTIPCLDDTCPELEHPMKCSRRPGHVLDMHIAMGIGEILAVWIAHPVPNIKESEHRGANHDG